MVRFRLLLGLLLGLLVLAMPVGLVASGQSLPPEVRQAVDATVQVRLGNYAGSGVYLGDGLYLSAAHVGRDAPKQGKVIFRDGGYDRVTVIKSDATYDLMMLQGTFKAKMPWVPLAEKNVVAGQQVFFAGYSTGRLAAWAGRVGGTLAPDGGAKPDWISATGSTTSKSGDSGGPMFTPTGRLCGILWGAGQTDTVATNCGRVRRFLLPWNARLEAWRQQQQCGPRGCPPQQSPGSPQGSGGRQVIDGGNLGWPTEPPGSSQAGQRPADPPAAVAPAIDHDLVAEAILKRMEAESEKWRGPPGSDGDRGPAGPEGPVGPRGPPGEVTNEHLASIVAAVATELKSDPSMRGRDGKDAEITDATVEAIAQRVLAELPGQRVMLVDGSTGTVLDDETYAPGEPIVLDFQRVIHAARSK